MRQEQTGGPGVDAHARGGDARLPLREKVGYGIGDFGFNLYWANIAAFLLILLSAGLWRRRRGAYWAALAVLILGAAVVGTGTMKDTGSTRTATVVVVAGAAVVGRADAAATVMTTITANTTTKAAKRKAAAVAPDTGSSTASARRSSPWATSSRSPCAARTARR